MTGDSFLKRRGGGFHVEKSALVSQGTLCVPLPGVLWVNSNPPMPDRCFRPPAWLWLLCGLLCQCAAPPHQRKADPPGGAWHRVTSRLAKAVPQDQEGHPVQWQFSIREGSGTNARSWPDGRIEVTAGTLGFVQGEAELAAVIAHEMAHVFCRHGWQRSMESWAVLLAGGALGAVLAAQGNDASTALGSASGAVLTVSLTALTARQRDQEDEADRVSLDLMRRAGYSPEAAVRFWQRYTTARARLGLGKAHWWKSHPPDALRVQRLQDAAAAR